MIPPRRIAFAVEYDGTGYHGWQIQPGGLPTIQGALITAISDLLQAPAQVDGASRTDAGVHALDQLAAVTLSHPINASSFVKAVNSRLPDAIAIRGAREVPLDFAPRMANGGKTYCYRIYASRWRRPLVDRTAWRVGWSLDTDLMAEAASHLVGTHDFTSFAAKDGSHQTAIRTLSSFDLTWNPHEVLEIRVIGTAFLKQMVRNLVGTLVEVGRGHWPVARVPEALAALDRQKAGPTAPARGLTLEVMHPGQK